MADGGTKTSAAAPTPLPADATATAQPAARWVDDWKFAVFLFTLCGVVEAFGFGHLTAFVPVYLPELGVAPEDIARWASILAAAAFVFGLPLSPFWGVWADRYSPKLMIARSFYAEVVVFALAAAAPNIWVFLLARLLVGLALGSGGIQFAIVAARAPRKQMAFAISTITMGPVLGNAFGPTFGGFWVGQWGVRSLLAFDAAMILLLAIAVTLLLRDPPRSQAHKPTVWQLFARLGRTLRTSPVVLSLFAVHVLVMGGFTMSRPLVPVLVATEYTGPDLAAVIGLVITAYGVGFLVFAPIWGKLAERTGYLAIYRIGILMMGLSLVAQAFTADVVQTGLVMTIQGIFQASITAMFAALLAANTAAEVRGSILALVYFPQHLANIAGNGVGSLVVGLGVHAAFMAAGISVLLAFAGLILTELRFPMRVRRAED